MASVQVSSTSYNNNDIMASDGRIKTAINSLLFSQATQVEQPTIQLTQCSPDVDVVMIKQGGICTRCNSMFKSRTSLMTHIEKCYNTQPIVVNSRNNISTKIPVLEPEKLMNGGNANRKSPIINLINR